MIIDALASHDGGRAAAAMRRHVASGYERFIEALNTPPA